MKLLAQSALFLAFLSLTFGLRTLLLVGLSAVTRTFLIACAGICFWAISFFLSNLLQSTFFEALHGLGNASLSVFVLPFIQVFFSVWDWQSSKVFRYLSFAITCLAIVLFRVEPLISTQDWRGLFFAFSPALIAIQVLWLVIHNSSLKPLIGVVYPRLFALCALLALLTCNMNHVQGLPLGLSVFGNGVLILLIYFFSQAIVKNRKIILFEFFENIIFMAFFAVLMTGVFSMIFTYARGDLALKFLNAGLASILIFVMADTLKAYIRKILRVFGFEIDSEWVDKVKDFRSKLVSIVDLRELEALLESTLKLRLEFSKVEVWFDSKENKLKRKDDLSTNWGILESNLPPKMTFFWRNQVGKTLEIRIYQPVLPRSWNQSLTPLEVFRDLGEDLVSTFERIERIQESKAISNSSNSNEEMQKNLSLMSQGLAHELRNPMATLQLALDLLAEEPTPQTLGLIEDQIQKLNRLVSNFQRLATPYASDELTSIPLKESALRWVDSHPNQEIDVEFIGKDQETFVYFSESMLAQVLDNLMQNSLRAYRRKKKESTEALGGEQYLSVEIDLERATISFKDRAGGMSTEEVKRARIPFVSGFKEGMGLGLSLCQRMMELSHGELDIRSEEGIGTEVILAFRVIDRSMVSHRTKEFDPMITRLKRER